MHVYVCMWCMCECVGAATLALASLTSELMLTLGLTDGG